MKQKENTSYLNVQILKCLHYFDLFDHPLNITEIQRFLSTKSDKSQTAKVLDDLVSGNSVLKFQEYFGLNNIEEKVQNRIKYEQNALQHHDTSVKNGIIILNIPFVSGVCISGSLSKGVMKEDADIDYFIFAKNGKIWLAKFFVKAYKMFFLKNSKELFCTNYFISDKKLKINEQNLYTATELATLIPINSRDMHSQLLNQNTWYKDYLPNASVDQMKFIEHPFKKNKVKQWSELLLNNKLGSLFNHTIRYATILRSKIKYKKKKNTDFELMYRSTVDQIKVHDSNHQNNTMRKYNSKINEISI